MRSPSSSTVKPEKWNTPGQVFNGLYKIRGFIDILNTWVISDFKFIIINLVRSVINTFETGRLYTNFNFCALELD